jgi:glycosyltransferase involved in cell wall biosynthesis
MKISIITVCYNSEKYIKSAIESVLNQDYRNKEYIIIDGNSTDSTIEIVDSYKDRIDKIISGPDSGIYDAMNKGLKLATGDIICFLNSDDLYIDNQVLSGIVDSFSENECEIVYGNLFYVKAENTEEIIRTWNTKAYKAGSFNKGWHPAHPAFFVTKKIYDKYGLFDLRYRLAADFELMLRFLEKYHVKSYYIDRTLVRMRVGGATNKNYINIFKQNIECYKAFKYNGLPVSILYPLYRLVPKLFQFRKTND